MKVCSVCLRCYEDIALSCTEESHEALTAAREGSCSVTGNYRLEFLQDVSLTEETYRAVNPTLKKNYLIKIIAPSAFDETAKKQFLSETQALSSLFHPNVVRVFESGTLADGSLYFVSEFFEAQTLRECLINVGSPSEVTALTITRQAAEGLEALHAAGILHRNIRPENIILTSDAENKFVVKLQNMDFGSLRQTLVNADPEQYISDLRYFSPEQCVAEPVDAQTDVYSLGVVLYETLAGRVPFDAAYADALIAKQSNEMPPPVKINSFDLRMLLTHTLTDALQKTPRTRLKSANALTRRLRHIEQLATHTSTPPPAMSYPEAMNKTAVVFPPPAKALKVEAPVPVKIEPLVESASPVETPAAVIEEKTPALEMQTVQEEPIVAEVVENPSPAESESPSEKTAAPESAPIAEISAIESQPLNEETAEEILAEESRSMIENAAAPAPAVEEPIPVETQTTIEADSAAASPPAFENSPVIETLPAVEAEIPVETLPAVEMQTVFESQPAETQTAAASTFVESQPAIEVLPVLEEPPASENIISVEIPAATAAEAAASVEAQPVEESARFAEDQAFVEEAVAVEEPVAVQAESEEFAAARLDSELEDRAAAEIIPETVDIVPEAEESSPVELQVTAQKPVWFEAQTEIEEPVLIETRAENITPAEIAPEPANSDAIELLPVAEEISEPESVMPEPAAPLPVFIDLTTTKLPPIETVVEKRVPENIAVTKVKPILKMKSGLLGIHNTSDPALVDWEQPDDVPTITQALDVIRKEDADAAFVEKVEKSYTAKAGFIDEEDSIIEAGEVDAPRSEVAMYDRVRPDYAADRAVFSYDDSGISWNLPDNRKVLTGVGLFAVLVLLGGGTFLRHQFQSASAARQTTAQTSAEPQPLPKVAEPVKVAETDKSKVAKPENSTVSKLPASADTSEMPDYQPRETDAKIVAPTTTAAENRGKKRVLKEAVEKLDRGVQTKNSASEATVFDKKGNMKTTDNKSAIKNQTSTTTRTDVFSRPRIVKTPKF